VIRAANERIAVFVTDGVSTMWCTYAFLLWSLTPALIPSMTDLVSYVSQSIIQLVLLPLIMVGQSVLSRASDVRAADMHCRLRAMTEIIEETREELAILRELQAQATSGAWACRHEPIV